jgi:hypothetical protein
MENTKEKENLSNLNGVPCHASIDSNILNLVIIIKIYQPLLF